MKYSLMRRRENDRWIYVILQDLEIDYPHEGEDVLIVEARDFATAEAGEKWGWAEIATLKAEAPQ